MFEIRVDSISNNKAWIFFWGGGDVTLIFQIFIYSDWNMQHNTYIYYFHSVKNTDIFIPVKTSLFKQTKNVQVYQIKNVIK